MYVTQVAWNGTLWPAATGWGTRPTVDNSKQPTCETFIPGFSGNLYGETVPVRFYKKIAGLQKFSSPEALSEAVQGWAQQAQAYFHKTF